MNPRQVPLLGVPVDLSTRLLAALRDLQEAPTYDALLTTTTDLDHALRLAVESYVGVQIVVRRLDQPVTLSVFAPRSPPRTILSSVAVPLTTTNADEDLMELRCFAAAPGALVDLATDLRLALHLGADDVRMDLSLTTASLATGMTGLAEVSMIEHAIGVLIGRGHDPDDAHAHLVREARAHQTTVLAWAKQTLDSVRRPQVDDDAR